ncbi:hypothetical protein [Glutamicibacter sp. NPDC087344]|uniref:hypothetical protein n=1 Tax=Glutamicibacter sp. NPDC087344 TaxID=3363994 RepID=UPI00381276B9
MRKDPHFPLWQFAPVFISLIACVWISIVGIFTYRYEQRAWFLLGKFDKYAHLYFDATKDFKDYAVSNFFGIISISILFTTSATITKYTEANIEETRWIVTIISGLLVFLAITSTGKVFGSGLHSLGKAQVERKSFQASTNEITPSYRR